MKYCGAQNRVKVFFYWDNIGIKMFTKISAGANETALVSLLFIKYDPY